MSKKFAFENETAVLFANTPKHLILPLELEKGPDARLYRNFLRVVSLFTFVLIFWASVAPIQEVSVAPGQIIPSSQIRAIQHLEGGVVESLMVREGDLVEENQIIVRIEPSAAASELGQLLARQRSLTLQKKRLEALAQGKALDPSEEDQLGVSQNEAYKATGEFRAEERKTLEARAAQKRAEYEAAQQEMASFNRQIGIYKEQLKIREQLFAQGFSSKKALLESQAQLEQVKIQHVSSAGKVAAAKQALAEAEQQVNSVQASSKKDDANDISKVTSELAEVQQTIIRTRDRYKRLDIRSPIKGYVQTLAPRSQGEVIKAGDVVAKIVPVDSNMVAEVHISPDHVGQIKIGSKADVKLATFDSSIYGIIKGEVQNISASTFQKENGELYYKALIHLDSNMLGPDGHRYMVSPGMTLTAEIITGSKSVMKYLMKPVYKSLGLAFSER